MQTKNITDAEVCHAVELFTNGHYPELFIHEILAMQKKCNIKIAWRALQRAEKRGYVEYGTSLRTGWLTDKGKEVVNAIRTHA